MNTRIQQISVFYVVFNLPTRTEEHVIPKWLQHEFNLWDQKLGLLNGSLIPYRLLTIPCCFQCNNIHLSPFENKVRAAYKQGFEKFSKLDDETIFLWVGKIYFGLMYRQLFLRADKKDETKGTITTPDYVKSFYSHFMFLQGIRKLHSFKDFFPASIYPFRTQKPPLGVVSDYVAPVCKSPLGVVPVCKSQHWSKRPA